ncbi:MAG: DMT family transporter [Devosiaceae bacterium]
MDITLWLLLALAWSSSFSVIKLGIETVDPVVLVAGRMTIAAALIFGLFSAMGFRLSSRISDWISYTITGLLGSVIPFLLITYGEQSVDSALAAILMGLNPVITAALAASILPDERMTLRVFFGLLGALTGVALLVGTDALTGLSTTSIGQAAIVGATLCYATSTVYIRRFVKRPALEMAAGSSVVGTIAICLVVVIIGADVSSVDVSPASLGAIVYLGVISTAAANLIYFYLVPRLGATRMSQVNFAVPVGGTIIGIVFLSEIITAIQLFALAIIIGSVWLTTSARFNH